MSGKKRTVVVEGLIDMEFRKRLIHFSVIPWKKDKKEHEGLEILELIASICKENFIPYKEYMRNHDCRRCDYRDRMDELMIPIKYINRLRRKISFICSIPEPSKMPSQSEVITTQSDTVH